MSTTSANPSRTGPSMPSVTATRRESDSNRDISPGLGHSSPLRDYLTGASTVFDLSGDSFQSHLRVPAKKLTAQYYAAAATRTLCAYARLAKSMAKLADWPDDCKLLVSDPDQGGPL